MERSNTPASALAAILDELATLSTAALQTVRTGDQRELREISQRLLSLHASFAIEYRAMLAAEP